MPALYALILIVAALHITVRRCSHSCSQSAGANQSIDIFAVIGLSFVLGVFAWIGRSLLLPGTVDLAVPALGSRQHPSRRSRALRRKQLHIDMTAATSSYWSCSPRFVPLLLAPPTPTQSPGTRS
jgi:hypothetical protein